MTVRDIYTYTSKIHEFIVSARSEPKKILFRGHLDDCPIALLDEEVYEFKALDFNSIEIVLWV